MKKLLTILAMIAACLSPIAITSPAFAQTCDGSVILKTSVGHGRASWFSRGITLSSEFRYQHCPNGTNPSLVKPTSIKWCWDWDGEAVPGLNFAGVRYNAYIQDNNEVVNPDTFSATRGGAVGEQRCEVQNIAADKERWLEVSQNARWWARGAVLIDFQENPTDTWEKQFAPGSDPGGP